MGKFVEDTDNIVFQLFNEFNEYLNAMYVFHTSKEKIIRNLALTAIRLHSRVIAAFFQKEGAFKDDLLYIDLLDTSDDLSLTVPDEVNRFINKTTAHISKKRGKIQLSDDVFFEYEKKILIAIKDFMDMSEELLKQKYKSDYFSEDVIVVKKLIHQNLKKVADLLVRN